MEGGEMAETTLYDILDVSREADVDEIRAAYRRLTSNVHPDRGGSGALFRLVQEAYETLRDPLRRREYDQLLLPSASHGQVAASVREVSRAGSRVDSARLRWMKALQSQHSAARRTVSVFA
jgi:DnaJ-class molecular chaperone